jgi:hypothetical protein
MDTFITRYEHLGVMYEHDAYTGTTRPIRDAMSDAAFRAACDRPLDRIYPKYTVPEPKPVTEARTLRVELMEKAAELAKTILKHETPDEWRIRKGYLWTVTSPAGRIYRETIKPVTIKVPDDYVEYNALVLAHGAPFKP